MSRAKYSRNDYKWCAVTRKHDVLSTRFSWLLLTKFVCTRVPKKSRTRVPGLGHIVCLFCLFGFTLLGESCWAKKSGASWEIARKSRNSWRVSGGGVGAHGQLTRGANWRQSYNQIQTLKECLCYHIYCAHLGTPCWHRTVTASRAVSDRESRYPPRVVLRKRTRTWYAHRYQICIFEKEKEYFHQKWWIPKIPRNEK